MRFYQLPISLLDESSNQLQFIPYIFSSRFTDTDKSSVFTLSLLMNYYSIDGHHRRIGMMKSAVERLCEYELLDVNRDFLTNIDKNTPIEVIFIQNSRFVAIYEFEFTAILSKMNEVCNYNLLNLFASIKSTSNIIKDGKFSKNQFGSTSVPYKKLSRMTGITNNKVIKDGIDLLVDCGVLELTQIVLKNKKENVYSFKVI